MPPESGQRTKPAMVGLTGAVAAGKSAALEAFAKLGAATLSSDAVVHDLLGDPEVVERLVERWGAEVAPGGQVDRGRVGARVFADREELSWLEALLHPLVGERFARWARGLPESTRLAVVEVPLLFETGMEQSFDATVTVAAEDRIRLDRAKARGTDLVAERDGRQLSPDEKEARATFVVRNNGSREDLEAALEELLPQLEALAG